jgi:hypothetical protein
MPLFSLPQRWVAGLGGHPGGRALSPAPKEPGLASEYVVILPLSAEAAAQERQRSQRPVTPRRFAPVSEGSHRVGL